MDSLSHCFPQNIFKYTASDQDTIGDTSYMTWSIECDADLDAETCSEDLFPFAINPGDGQLFVDDPDDDIIVESMNRSFYAKITVRPL